MKCEYCSKEHNGNYGEGRFCGSKCARGFSTKEKREYINKKVSEKMKGHRPIECFKKGHIQFHVFNRKDMEKAKITKSNKRQEILKKLAFENLPRSEIKKIVFKEQEGKCNICGIIDWNNLAISLELHHKDGDGDNNKRENLEYLCPNCHSQTDDYRSRSIPIKKRKLLESNL